MIDLIFQKKPGSRGLLVNIPNPDKPIGPWKFWKSNSIPVFGTKFGYESFEYDSFSSTDNSMYRAGYIYDGSNFEIAAYSPSINNWETSNGGSYTSDPESLRPWTTYAHCERLGFSPNAYFDENNNLVANFTWLKPSSSSPFDPPFGRPYSGGGGFQKLIPEPVKIAGVVADWSTWWYSPSKIKGEYPTNLINSDGVLEYDASVSGWLGKPRIWYQDYGVHVGPYSAKFLCAICFAKTKTMNVPDGFYAFPLYWSEIAGDPDGFDLDKLGSSILANQDISDMISVRGDVRNVCFDIKIHAIVYGVRPGLDFDGLPTHQNYNKTADVPNNLFYNTHFFVEIRLVAGIRRPIT